MSAVAWSRPASRPLAACGTRTGRSSRRRSDGLERPANTKPRTANVVTETMVLVRFERRMPPSDDQGQHDERSQGNGRQPRVR